LIAIIPVLAGQTGVIPDTAGQGVVYIVSRATTAESRALFSARLLKMNATKLHWYEDASVVRVQMSTKAADNLRADRDVVLVLSESDQAALAGIPPESAPLVPAATPPSLMGCASPGFPQPAVPFPPLGSLPPMPMGGTGLGVGGLGLVDSLAGGVAQRLLNRPPSCKVSVARNSVKYGPEGGEGLIEINASGSCAWQAQASVTWIKILSGSGVSGSGIVSYSVDPANGKERSGAIWIATSPAGSPIKGNASQVVTQTK
jgi:hypothetical protein